MAKKTFVSKTHIFEGKKWYIDYTTMCTLTDVETRHRKDFDLNTIEDIPIRRLVAERICKFLDGFSVELPEIVPKPVHTDSLRSAVQAAVSAKLTSPRTNTHKGYKSISKQFLEWCRVKKYDHQPVSLFSKKMANVYFDYLRGKKTYANTTLRNHLIHLRALWTVIMEREDLNVNPFQFVKPDRPSEKTRRAFTSEERKIVAAYIEENDPWLFRALLLQFFCYIRPVEILRLRFKSFDLQNGTITIESAVAKKWKKRVVTIPSSVLQYFAVEEVAKCPGNYYLFGRVGEGKDTTMGPSTKKSSDNRCNKQHKKILQVLQKSEKIPDISGLSWYSWKDTGITLHVHGTSPMATRDQAGHGDFNMTLTYYHDAPINKEYKELDNDLFT